jgi:hypothetical protein
MNNNLTLPTEMRHTGEALGRVGEAVPRQPHPWSRLFNHSQTRGIRTRTATVREHIPRLSPKIPNTVKHPPAAPTPPSRAPPRAPPASAVRLTGLLAGC